MSSICKHIKLAWLKLAVFMQSLNIILMKIGTILYLKKYLLYIFQIDIYIYIIIFIVELNAYSK